MARSPLAARGQGTVGRSRARGNRGHGNGLGRVAAVGNDVSSPTGGATRGRGSGRSRTGVGGSGRGRRNGCGRGSGGGSIEDVVSTCGRGTARARASGRARAKGRASGRGRGDRVVTRPGVVVGRGASRLGGSIPGVAGTRLQNNTFSQSTSVHVRPPPASTGSGGPSMIHVDDPMHGSTTVQGASLPPRPVPGIAQRYVPRIPTGILPRARKRVSRSFVVQIFFIYYTLASCFAHCSSVLSSKFYMGR